MPGFLISAVIGAAFSSLFSGAAFLTSLAFAVAKGAVVYLIRSLFADDPEPPPQPQTNFVQAVSASQYVFGYSRITPPLVFAGRAVDSEATTEDLDALFSGDTSKTLGFEFRFRNHGNMVCVYALSEGAADIEGIERMWSNNVEVPLKLHATTTTYKHYVSEAPYRDTNPGKGYPTIMAYVIPAATRTGSAATKSALSAVMRKLYPNKWTTDHGLPMAHMVVIYKPTANNRRTDDTPERSKEACLVNGVPKIEVLLKGMKLALPTDADGTLAAATWTRNAADIRWWFETHIRGRTVNYASYAAAKTICGQTVNPPGTPVASTPALDRLRYAADGAFRANEDLDAVAAQLDRCWQGFTALKNGEWHFYPGSLRAVATTINAADVIRVERTQLGAGIRDRYNQISASMQQSANADWQQTSLPLLIDGDAKTADGGLPLELKWGTLGYIIDPYQAVRCMRLALRRGRRTNLYQVTCVPGPMMANAELHPGDVVTFNHPLIHAINQRCVILNSTINPDMSVSLQLLREDSTVYTAAITDVPFGASGELSLNSVDNNREQELIDTIMPRTATRGATLSKDANGNHDNVMATAGTVLWFRQPSGPVDDYEWRDNSNQTSGWTRNKTRFRWYYVDSGETSESLVPLTDENGNQHTLASLSGPLAPTTYRTTEGETTTVVNGVSVRISGGYTTDDDKVIPATGSVSSSRIDVVENLETMDEIRQYVLGIVTSELMVGVANLIMRPLDAESDYGTSWLGTISLGTVGMGGTLAISGESREDVTQRFNFPEGFGSTPSEADDTDDTGGGTTVVPAGVRVAVWSTGFVVSWDKVGEKPTRRIRLNNGSVFSESNRYRVFTGLNTGQEYTLDILDEDSSTILLTAKVTPGLASTQGVMVTPGDAQLVVTAPRSRYTLIIDDRVLFSFRETITQTRLKNNQEYHVVVITSRQIETPIAYEAFATPTDGVISTLVIDMISARTARLQWPDGGTSDWNVTVAATSGLVDSKFFEDQGSPVSVSKMRPDQSYRVTVTNGTTTYTDTFKTHPSATAPPVETIPVATLFLATAAHLTLGKRFQIRASKLENGMRVGGIKANVRVSGMLDSSLNKDYVTDDSGALDLSARREGGNTVTVTLLASNSASDPYTIDPNNPFTYDL